MMGPIDSAAYRGYEYLGEEFGTHTYNLYYDVFASDQVWIFQFNIAQKDNRKYEVMGYKTHIQYSE